MPRVATAIWPISADLLLALDTRLGAPVDSYVNGSQTWFTGEDEILEWRLHPVASFRAPEGLSHYDVFEHCTAALAAGADPAAVPLGRERRAIDSLWEGLECFPAYDDDLEPATVASRATEVLGLAPELSGLVDHDAVGDAWEKAGGAVSIVTLLRRQLSP